MAQQLPAPRDYDAPLVHHFIRLMGRAPNEEELVRFRELSAQWARRRSLRLRLSAGRFLTRL